MISSRKYDKRLSFIEEKIIANIRRSSLSAEDRKIKVDCEKSFHTFVKHAWDKVDTDSFSDNWHIAALCDHLQAMYEKRFDKLLVNFPPRTGKTNIVYIFFVAWVWIHDPKLSFLCSAYSRDVAYENSTKCRDFIRGEWYQRFWGETVQLGSSQRKANFTNTAGGNRMSTPIKGANLGFGGHFILIDDPNNVINVFSDKLRMADNSAVTFITTSRTRKTTPRIILTQQRLHADDASANALKNNNAQKWTHLMIPERFVKEKACVTVPLKDGQPPWRDPRKKEGELLDPSWRTKEWLERVDIGMPFAMREAQYQQNPLLKTGNILNPEWFRPLRQRIESLEFTYILQSWDTALSTAEESAYSVCTTWGCFEDNYGNSHVVLLHIYSGRLRFPDLRNKAIHLDDVFNPDEILIEKKVSGFSLIQELQNFGLPATPFIPNKYGDKEMRCVSISGFIEAGFVWLPWEGPDYIRPTSASEKIMYAAQYFPQSEANSDTADIIDSMSQALIKLSERSLLANRARIRNHEDEQEWRKNDTPRIPTPEDDEE